MERRNVTHAGYDSVKAPARICAKCAATPYRATKYHVGVQGTI
jgi:hypothetical protein